MKIHFNAQEKLLIKQHAEKFREKTGDNYSLFHIMSILSSFYEEHLDEDLKKVMDVKFREFEENKAKEGEKV